MHTIKQTTIIVANVQNHPSPVGTDVGLGGTTGCPGLFGSPKAAAPLLGDTEDALGGVLPAPTFSQGFKGVAILTKDTPLRIILIN